MFTCSICGEPIPNHQFFQKVEGWERPGRGMNDRSGSSLVLRKKLPEIACSTCIVTMQNGLHREQLTLG